MRFCDDHDHVRLKKHRARAGGTGPGLHVAGADARLGCFRCVLAPGVRACGCCRSSEIWKRVCLDADDDVRSSNYDCQNGDNDEF